MSESFTSPVPRNNVSFTFSSRSRSVAIGQREIEEIEAKSASMSSISSISQGGGAHYWYQKVVFFFIWKRKGGFSAEVDQREKRSSNCVLGHDGLYLPDITSVDFGRQQ